MSGRARVTGRSWQEVDRFLEALLVGQDRALTEALAAAEAAGLPRHEVAPLQGKLLMLLARMVQARTALELGTLGGYSTIWLARGVHPDGRVISVEADPERAAVAREAIRSAGSHARVSVLEGAALDLLPAVEADAPFDLVFLDADKRENPDYLGWALRLARPGTVIVADNVVRAGAVVDAGDPDPRVRGVRRFLELVAGEPRLTATALQTVGAKGHDGLLIAVVTDG
jgi:predicted O-methyltransferase YrrM